MGRAHPSVGTPWRLRRLMDRLHRVLAWLWAHAVLAVAVGIVVFCVGYFVYIGWLIAS
jgi:hypothetical protein